MKTIGYMKNSDTKELTLEDVNLLNKNKVESIFKENKNSSENLEEAIRLLEKGDILITPKLSHIALTSREYLKISREILKKEALLIVLDKPICSIENNLTKDLLQQLTDMDKSYRTNKSKDGLKKARDRGVALGRQYSYQDRESELIELYTKPTSKTTISKEMNIPLSTVNRMIKRLISEGRLQL